jgi:hypothetical protein
VAARAEVKSAINTNKLSPEESDQMIKDHQDRLQFTPAAGAALGWKALLSID